MRLALKRGLGIVCLLGMMFIGFNSASQPLHPIPAPEEAQRLEDLAAQTFLRVLEGRGGGASPFGTFFQQAAVEILGGRLWNYCIEATISQRGRSFRASMSFKDCHQLMVNVLSLSLFGEKLAVKVELPRSEAHCWDERFSSPLLRRILHAPTSRGPFGMLFERIIRLQAVHYLAMLGDEEAIEALIEDLKTSGEESPLLFGLAEVIMAQPEVVPRLVELLASPDPAFREGLIWAFGLAGRRAAAAVPALVELLAGDPDAEVRLGVAEALGWIRDPAAVPALIRALEEDREPRVRAAAASALGLIGDPEAIPALLAALEDEPRVQEATLIALALLGKGNEAVLAAVRAKLTEGKTGEVRGAAAWALALMGDRESIPRLIGLLEDPESIARGSAALALGLLKARRAIPALQAAFGEEPYAEVRLGILIALLLIDESALEPILSEALSDLDPLIRLIAALSAVRLGHAEEAVPVVLKLLNDPDEFTALRAISLLIYSSWGDPRIASPFIPALRDLLEDRDLKERLVAPLLSALIVSSRDPEQLPILIELAHDEAPSVRAQAVSALGRLGLLEGFDGIEAATQVLVETLENSAPEVRQEAIRGLAIHYLRSWDPALLSLIEGALDDRAGLVRLWAAEALVDIAGWIRASGELLPLEAEEGDLALPLCRQLGEYGFYGFQSFSAVADLIFHRWPQLGQRFAIALRDKYGIVAETVCATGLLSDMPLKLPFCSDLVPIGQTEHGDADEAGLAIFILDAFEEP